MTNLDILVANEMANMYSENENAYMTTCISAMYDELKEETEE